MTTEAMAQADEEAAGVRSSWYVALGQLPGMPGKVQLEVAAIVLTALKRLPVLARRDHFWSGSAHALAYAAEDSEVPEDHIEDEDVPLGAAPLEPGHEASPAFGA
jgi:hypothetical protein